MKQHILLLSALLPSLFVLSSCDPLGGLYDEALEEDNESGPFTITSEANGITQGTLTVDATSYTTWIYVDLHNLTADNTLLIPASEEEADALDETAFDWDFAVHRFDAKTNNGRALETEYTSIAALLSDGYKVPSAGYTEDEFTTEQVIIDMSQMMSGIFGYGYTNFNSVLSEWCNAYSITMPPTYVHNEHVFILEMADNTHAAIHLDTYMNSASIKAHMTFSFAYPID